MKAAANVLVQGEDAASQGVPKVGVDVSKATLDLHVGSQTSRRARLSVANTQEGFAQAERWLQQHAGSKVHVCLEATGTYSDAVARFFYEQGHQVSVINPRLLVAFRKSENIHSKTDRLDALLLARFCEQKRPRLWHPPSMHVQQMQLMKERVLQLQTMAQSEANRLENLRLPQTIRERIKAHVAFLEQEMQRAKEDLEQWIEEDEESKRQSEQLQTIKGIGQWSASCLLVFLAGLPEHAVAEVVAQAGLCPSQHESGTSVRGPSAISKMGDPSIRKILYMCALVAKTHDPDMKQWAQELEARGKCKKVVIVACMRKLLHIAYGVFHSDGHYDPRKAWPSHYLTCEGSEPLSQVA